MSSMSVPLVSRSLTLDIAHQTIYIRRDIGSRSSPLSLRATNIVVFPGATVWGTSIEFCCSGKFIHLGHLDSRKLAIVAAEAYIGGTKRANEKNIVVIIHGEMGPVFGSAPAIEALNKIAGETLFKNSQDSCPLA